MEAITVLLVCSATSVSKSHVCASHDYIYIKVLRVG